MFLGVSLGFTGYYWIILDYPRLYRVLLGLIGNYIQGLFTKAHRVLLGFTGLNWVKQGFTGLQVVALGFQGVSKGFYWVKRNFNYGFTAFPGGC